jgi:hypothetical protein
MFLFPLFELCVNFDESLFPFPVGNMGKCHQVVKMNSILQASFN